MSELASVATVPPAGAAALSVMVHVAESPLPPAMIDGLHVNELAVCAYALEVSSAHAIRPMPTANPDCFAAPLDLTRYLLSNARAGLRMRTGADGVQTSGPRRTEGFGDLTRGVYGQLVNARLTNDVRTFGARIVRQLVRAARRSEA